MHKEINQLKDKSQMIDFKPLEYCLGNQGNPQSYKKNSNLHPTKLVEDIL